MFNDFTDLLYLVKECPLDSMDPILAQLKKQPRKWFKKLIKLVINVAKYTHTHTYSSVCEHAEH